MKKLLYGLHSFKVLNIIDTIAPLEIKVIPGKKKMSEEYNPSNNLKKRV